MFVHTIFSGLNLEDLIIIAVGFHCLLERSVDSSSASVGPTETAIRDGRYVRFPLKIRETFTIEFATP